MPCILLLFTVPVLLFTLNLFWFFKILAGARKLLFGGRDRVGLLGQWGVTIRSPPNRHSDALAAHWDPGSYPVLIGRYDPVRKHFPTT